MQRDPAKIAAFLAAPLPQGHARVIFSTYQSLDKIRAAQQRPATPAFTLAIADEAHRTAGTERTAPASAKKAGFYQEIHKQDSIRAQKRLYMTATPKVFTPASRQEAQQDGQTTVASMDDPEIYGNVLYHLKFKQALAANMLTDYRVIALFIPEGDIAPAVTDSARAIREATISQKTQEKGRGYTQDITRITGAMQALNGEMLADDTTDLTDALRKSIGFCNTREMSHFYAKMLSSEALNQAVAKDIPAKLKKPLPVSAVHLDAQHNAIARADALSELELADSAAAQEARVICNVGLFGEGIDVPSLDAVIFFEPRDSQVDIVQSVGRVMRNAPGKRYGYIIVPTVIPDPAPGQRPLDALLQNAEGFNAIGRALSALQSHDESLAENIARKLIIAELPRPLQPAPLQEQDLEDRSQRRLGLLFTEDGATAAYQAVLARVMQKSGLANPGRRNAAQIVSAVQDAGSSLHRHGHVRRIADALGESRASLVIRQKNDPEKPDEKQTAERELAVCTIGAVVVSSAALLHKRIANAGDVIPNLRGFANFGALPSQRAFLQQQWRLILEKDYQPIFHPALAVLDALPDSPETNRILARLVANADAVADTLSEMGYDHAGPLYHTILGKKGVSDGALYTKNTAALLLAKLAIPQDWQNAGDWNADAIRALRIMDPACGTGTLLLAASNVIKERIKTAQADKGNQGDTLPQQTHQHLVQDVLCGLDINPQAVQIAAANLCITAPSVRFDRINLFAMKHGVDAAGAAHAGSLELLTGDDLSNFTRQFHNLQTVAAAHVDASGTLDFPVGDLDMVIMNPPFSSHMKRGSKWSVEDRKRMQQREQEIRKITEENVGAAAANTIDSKALSTFFSPLATTLLNKQRGTLAMVTPAVSCVAPSALNNRQFLAANFHIEKLVTSHAHQGFSFSGNTDIHECLLVARRWDDSRPRPDTQITVLGKMPQNTDDVDNLAAAINSGDMGDWGAQHNVPADKIRAGDWNAIQWHSGELAQAAQQIYANPALRPLGDIYSFGTMPITARVTLEKDDCDKEHPAAIPAFWTMSAKLRHTIHAEVTEYRKPRADKEPEAQKLLAGAGNFLIPHRINTQSGIVMGIYSPDPAIGGYWTPIQTPTPEHAKALAVWWNSTISWLALLNNRGGLLTWPAFAVANLKTIPIPDLSNPATLNPLLRAYDQIATQPLCRMQNAANDPTRQIIDQAAAQAANIPPRTLHHYRTLLAQEPTIRRPDHQTHPRPKTKLL